MQVVRGGAVMALGRCMPPGGACAGSGRVQATFVFILCYVEQVFKKNIPKVTRFFLFLFI